LCTRKFERKNQGARHTAQASHSSSDTTWKLAVDFIISGLAAAPFAPFFEMPDDMLAARGAARIIAQRRPGFPCRVSLREADVGETVLLVNFEHLSGSTPYRSRYAIFVREHAAEAELAVNEIPEVLTTRLLSLRAFSAAGMLIDADVANGRDVAAAIGHMLGMCDVQYIHVHNAKPGCFAARVDRAPT
jgi:Protein of unknown function (DUF1203)